MAKSLTELWDKYRSIGDTDPMALVVGDTIYTSPNKGEPAREDVERRAYLKQNILQIKYLSRVYNLQHQSANTSSQNDTLILPHLIEHHLNHLQYSDDTYALIANIVRTVAFAFYTQIQNNFFEQCDTSDQNQRREYIYAQLNFLFADQVQTIIPNFERAAVSYCDKFPDATGYTNLSKIEDFSKSYDIKNFIALNPTHEEADIKGTDTINTVIHESTHKIMNAIYRSLYGGEDLPFSPSIRLDAWVNQTLIDGKILSDELVKDHYSIYRAIPDERLAFYAGNSFETWMRIISAVSDDETNILADPEKREQVINMFNCIEPTIRNWSDNRDKANDTMHQFFKDLYPS
jgi:hypothetical protein